jgi:hypothetical protein
MTIHKYRDGYSGLNTSDEILAAIEAIAGDDIRDEESEAYRIWNDPTKEEITQVEARAFAMTDDETLGWGETIVRRPTK